MAAPFGAVLLREDQGALVSVEVMPFSRPLIPPGSPVLEEAVRQFEAYFEDPRWTLTLPLLGRGTRFQQLVWNALKAIPVGEARSYGRLSAVLGSGPRAVAGACRANEVPIIIPCHRVVSGQGLGGYCGRLSGPYLDIKRWLLRHEGYAVS
ncbi:MAG: Methylated-DNA-(protein)-cysteine S-methyltransferase [Proteobacteria bacterium]|nr:Methylated-DNA-(protein)-cysteine S-methyltransferase [Pseudomonadota bacterium]